MPSRRGPPLGRSRRPEGEPLNSWVNALASVLPPRRQRVVAQHVEQLTTQVASQGTGLSEENLGVLTLLNDELNRRLDRQWDTITQLDTKAGLLLTFAVAAVGLLVGRHDGAWGYAAAVAFTGDAVLTLLCVAVRAWDNAPAPGTLVRFENAEAPDLYDRIVRAKAMAYLANETNLTQKADWLKLATWWMAVPVALTVVALSS